MTEIYSNGRFEADRWRELAADEPIPAGGYVILSKARLLVDAGALPDGVPIGVQLAAGDHLEDIIPYLPRLALVAVHFPKFADGRGFSLARLLRERHGFAGAIRAVGDVLLDLIPLMQRVGISEFAVTHEPTRHALAGGHMTTVPFFYQPGWAGDAAERPAPDGRPWLRRAI